MGRARRYKKSNTTPHPPWAGRGSEGIEIVHEEVRTTDPTRPSRRTGRSRRRGGERGGVSRNGPRRRRSLLDSSVRPPKTGQNIVEVPSSVTPGSRDPFPVDDWSPLLPDSVPQVYVVRPPSQPFRDPLTQVRRQGGRDVGSTRVLDPHPDPSGVRKDRLTEGSLSDHSPLYRTCIRSPEPG